MSAKQANVRARATTESPALGEFAVSGCKAHTVYLVVIEMGTKNYQSSVRPLCKVVLGAF